MESIISIFLKGSDIPCISPSIGNCITTSGYKSASCKEIKVVVNGNEINYIVESCGESFNSCCQQELTVCRDIYGKLSTKWVMLPNHIDNCYLNNDQNCKFTCEEYGDGGWFPPKINFFDLEDDQVLKMFNYSNNSLKYNTNNTKLFCTISNVLGEKLYSNEITNKNEIYLEGNHKIIFVNLYDGKSYQTLKFIQE